MSVALQILTIKALISPKNKLFRIYVLNICLKNKHFYSFVTITIEFS